MHFDRLSSQNNSYSDTLQMISNAKSKEEDIKNPNTATVYEISNNASESTCNPEKPAFDDIDHAKLLKKMDFHIIPGITILFLLSFVDRGNIGNAKIEGLSTDLHLSGHQWSMVLTVFYFTYSPFEVPFNMLMARFRPSIILPLTMVLWGIVVTLTSLVKNYHQLLVLRLLLGITESALYPGAVFYLTKWYTRRDLQYRQALFFAAASGAGAFSGILAYGIAFMKGIAGLNGWCWIFIIEGIFTVVVAIMMYFIVYDYPETAKFLTERERKYILYKLKHDFSTTMPVSEELLEEVYSKKDKGALKAAFTDWQLYCHILVHWSLVTTLYTVSFFLPSIVKSLGFKNANAQLMTVPPYIAAVIFSLITAYYSDKMNLRSLPIFCYHIILLVGYIMAICVESQKHPGVVYAAMFLIVIGSYSAFPGMISWLAVNLDGPYKRSIGIGAHIAFGNMGSTFATNYFRSQDAPNYRLGYGMSIMFVSIGMVTLSFINFRYYTINKKNKKDIANGVYDHMSPRDLLEMGDKNPYFVYKH